jgi:hypothetical protein
MYAELERKVCPKCGIAKEKKEFGEDSTKVDGVSSWCRPCKKIWRAEHRKENPEQHVEDYNRMYAAQEGKCACCGKHSSEFRRGLHVDHDHATGQVRALLCTKCNPGIGYFDDSIEKLEMAIQYLKKFKK